MHRSTAPVVRKPWRPMAAVLAALALVGAVALPATANAAVPQAAKPQTVISLTFDDGNANQLAAAAQMNTYKMKGTFYVVSGFIGAANYLTRANLDTLKAAGHEIGGHTVNHPDLAVLPADEVARQICNDRSVLMSWGYSVKSFAYPFASSIPANETAAKNCGYNSARMLGDLRSRFGCSGCSYTEKIPPAKPFYLKALDQVDNTWTLADLKTSVTNAEKTGGWVPFTFHNICASGCDLNVTPTVFGQFLQWLAPRATTNNTVVKTVDAVVGGALKPAVAGPVTAPAGPGVNAVVNPSLEAAGANGLPNCWMTGGYGSNTPSITWTSPARTGSVAGYVSVANYVDGDAKLLPAFDLGACTPTVVTGHTYSMRAWYTSTTVTQFAIYLRSTAGVWQYWTSSPWFAANPVFSEAVFTTPAIPAGFTGISFGLNVFSNGTLVTDDYSLYDTVGAPAPVTVAAPPAPTAAPNVQGPVEVHMNDGTDAKAGGTAQDISGTAPTDATGGSE
ncbi:polysaccharide deacetylase family protein [Herbiconiux daphne]|uniref:Polysaccharide deacetylase family protein n=1 Tax=Herbiconiux daphne TaxID=2970914 RepID=A0ABT2H039_9MICO|nr:polysaccharide deacetylase family protein [Herbiconiux daphne]MCS5732925.1 polysaccharide deacetylase family protein [Herbiconiux daphne]